MQAHEHAQHRLIERIRHMHREHSASLNPTCAQRAPFVFHTCHLPINLRTIKKGVTPTPT